ncbi:4-hydroxyphenylpyruvate dioxygenase [Chengkuizengella sediminis]|uniref:4-hydroxyphenylpyruvate dioxygenase n=1 Tax=Chengkuizengella sediminis TaxID=1885917 RepID=UPI00138A0B20|nr:4-hydroxyphenylpyruvate dioxygenase [Chengkuizengella sediminis]NDI34042.1 4-hydroxyphenylpyruvate dioxygenase [Chengkuizengella sediminis]
MRENMISIINKPNKQEIEDIDYIELYVGNAKQSAYYYCRILGLKIVAYSGLETGDRDRTSYVLKKGNTCIVVSSSHSNEHPISQFVNKRGDGIKDVAFRVNDVDEIYENAVANGAISIQPPYEESDKYGIVKKAIVGTLGDLTHTIVEKKDYRGVFFPGYKSINNGSFPEHNGITCIDHLAICVDNMPAWVSFYDNVFGFKLLKAFKKDEVSSSNSALMTKVMQNGTERVKLPIVEPAEGDKKSQIEEFLEYNKGPGIQHIALLTDDILETVKTMNENGIDFLYTPETYYQMLPKRVGKIDESIEELQKHKILVDKDDEGYLLQIFAQPIQDRPTLFFEVIQRKGSRGFGNGNIKALFEAVEREQEKRGNL